MLAVSIMQNKSGPRMISRQSHHDITPSLNTIFRGYHGNFTLPENVIATRPPSHPDLPSSCRALLIQVKESLDPRRKPAPDLQWS